MLLLRLATRTVLLSSLIARLPKGMVPLAVVLLVSERTGSYLVAGSVAGIVALSDAASTPVLGRLVDRVGSGRVVLPAAALHLAGTVGLLTAQSIGASLIAACLLGIGNPPISASMKMLWPRLVGKQELPTAYRVESLAQQVIFLAGPLLVAVIGDPAFALGLATGLLAIGSLWFVLTAPATDRGRAQYGRGALKVAEVRTLVGATALQGVVFGAAPVGLASFSPKVGLLLAALTLGGLLGTFLPNNQPYVRLLVGFALALTPVAVISSTAVMAVALAIAGLFLTPLAAATYMLLQQATDASHRTEAFAWLSTGQAAGSAMGAALAGLLVDHAGTALALALLPVVVALAAGLGRRLSC